MAIRITSVETEDGSIVIIRSYNGAVPKYLDDKDTVAQIEIFKGDPKYARIHVNTKSTADDIPYIIDALSTARAELDKLV